MQFPDMAIFLLVFARCGGAILLLPPWNWRDVPLVVRLGLAGVVAIAITPLIESSVVMNSSGLLIAAALRELMVGLTFGFMGALVFWGALLAGQVIEHYVGSGAAGGFAEEQLGPVARLYYLLALLLFIIIGGHHWLVQQLYHSFTVVPVAGSISAEPILIAVTGTVTQMFLIGLVMAAPVITALFLADVVLAMTARALPNVAWAPVLPAVRWPVALLALVITMPLLGQFVTWQFSVMQTNLAAFVSSL
jgi:flagellar biosynthetic protein FliR